MARLVVGLACVVLVLGLASAWQKPVFCREKECPEFSVVTNGTGYQLRRYLPVKIVATTFMGTWYKDPAGTRPAFRRLYNYITGANSQRVRIPMTVPVMITGLAGSGRRAFMMAFFLPTRFHANPPAPIDNAVSIKAPRGGNVYVRTYSGMPTEAALTNQLEQLKTNIGNSQLYRPGRFIAASYNRRYQRLNRHNEVWLIASTR